jgi:peptidoglycan hydrolase-like protein with peptidoglycan-binding domain
MYEHGLGVTRNLAIARSYYRRAAEAGSADARSKLAALGDGPPAGGAIMASATRIAAVAPATGGGHTAAPGSDRPLDRRSTAELQRLLARLDFAPGASDGVAGRRTVAAIRLYQEFAGLPVDGKPTLGLLNDIRDVSRTLGRTRP